MILDRRAMSMVLYRLSNMGGRAGELYVRLMGSWGHRPDRERVAVKVGDQDLSLLEALKLPDGTLGTDTLKSGWITTYQHPKKKHLGLVVQSKEKPTQKRRTFRLGRKKVRLVAVKLVPINQKEATVATKTKRGAKSKPVDEDLDELEGLEDLEDLEDLDDEEEPDDEELEDEDEEEDEPAPKRRGRTSAKKKAPAKKASRRKAAVEEDEDEDEDEDDEEDEAPRKRSTSKSKTSSKASSKSSKSAPKSKKDSAKKSKGGNGLPTTRELPKGQVGPTEIAEMVGGNCDSRYVRIFLRENYERPDGSRWAFSKGEAREIVRDIKRQRKGE